MKQEIGIGTIRKHFDWLFNGREGSIKVLGWNFMDKLGLIMANEYWKLRVKSHVRQFRHRIPFNS